MNRRRLAVLGLWLLALAGSALWLQRHLEVRTEMTVFLPPSATPAQRLLLGQLRDGVASRLMLIEVRGGAAPDLARASRDLARRLRDSGLFSAINNGDLAALAAERELILAHRYLLSPAVEASRFSAKGLEAALQESLESLASPAGALLRAAIPVDPTGELRELARLLVPGEGPQLRHGVWFSRDGAAVLLVAETRAAGFDVDSPGASGGRGAPGLRRRRARLLRARSRSPGRACSPRRCARRSRRSPGASRSPPRCWCC